MKTRRTSSSAETPPLLCAMLLALLFACALMERAADRVWRTAPDDDIRTTSAGMAVLDGQRAGIPAALSETRYVAGIGETRVRFTSTALPEQTTGRVAGRLPQTRRRVQRARTATLPQSRFRVCGYHAAPPTAPPESTPIS